MKELIDAPRARDLAGVRAAVKTDPAAARHPRPIVQAGQLGWRAAVELLQSHGADLNAKWKNYRPLHALQQEEPHAAAGKPAPERLECLEWMLGHGADPEELGAWPAARAIVVAAFVGQPPYIKVLRKGGAVVDGFAGAALGDRKLVEKALAVRPEFARERDHGGLTALQCAAGSRLPGAAVLEVAVMLLDAGAEIAAKTKSWGHDVDAVYFAASAKNLDLFRLLLDRGADPTAAVVPALWNGTTEQAILALEHGADLDRAVADGKPLLNHLICWGQIPQTMWLLANGASPNVPVDGGPSGGLARQRPYHAGRAGRGRRPAAAGSIQADPDGSGTVEEAGEARRPTAQ